jgi:hypothetical protein
VGTQVSPYRSLPGANIVVRSNETSASTDVTGLTLGGGSSLATDDSRWTAEGANETAWNAGGRRHRFKSLLWARADGLRQEGVPNQLGTFAFNSIADFAAGTPASFTRTLTQPERSGSVWNAAGALAHQYAPTRFFSMLYGARLDVDGFFSAPERNVALEQALGVQTGVAPTKIHVSPRLGFSYTYNRDKDNGNGQMGNNVGRFYRTTAGVIRGGIGDFRDLLRPGTLADASAATGLPGGTTYLSCVGAAVPQVEAIVAEESAAFLDWLKATERIPTDCPAALHGHAYLLYGHSKRKLIDDGVLLIGDAAGLAYAQSGEGIRPAIESGLLAAATVVAADGDYSSAGLAGYQDSLTRRFGSSSAAKPQPISMAVRNYLGTRLLRKRWFTRHVVLDRWFLHSRQSLMQLPVR